MELYSFTVFEPHEGHFIGKMNLVLLFVLFCDVIIKGFIPAYIIKNFTDLDLFIIIFLIIGHNWSLFIKLRGGKGLTVSLGILAAISTEVFISIIILFLIQKRPSRITGFPVTRTNCLFLINNQSTNLLP